MRNTRRLVVLLASVATALLIASGVALATLIEGDAGNNTLRGTDVADTLRGYGGDDTIYGMGGNDEVDGGDGADYLYGGDESGMVAGSDRVYGRAGDDAMFGGPGSDTLNGGIGNDVIEEGPPDDAVVDYIFGADGNDKIYAANGQGTKDYIRCHEGHDEVWVDSADDVGADCEIVHRDPARADLTFSQPVSVAEVVQLSQQYNSEMLMLASDYEAGEPMGDAYMEFPEASPVEIESAYEDQRLGFFADSLHTIEQMKPEDRADLQPQIDAMEAALVRGDVGRITISGATLTGDLQDLASLESASNASTETGDAVDTVVVTETKEIVAHSEAMEEEASEENVTPEAADEAYALDSLTSTSTQELVEEPATAPDPEQEEPSSDGAVYPEGSTYWPNVGYSYVQPSWRGQYKGSHNYSKQWFQWDNDNLGFWDGYEHDFKLSLSDNKTFLNERLNAGCFPHPYGRYVSTNLPGIWGIDRYIDTNFDYPTSYCEREDRAYTVGISRANGIKSGKWYYSFFRTYKGKDSADIATLEAQINRPPVCGPPSVYPAWCSFKNGSRAGGGDIYLVDTDAKGEWYPVPRNLRWTER